MNPPGKKAASHTRKLQGQVCTGAAPLWIGWAQRAPHNTGAAARCMLRSCCCRKRHGRARPRAHHPCEHLAGLSCGGQAHARRTCLPRPAVCTSARCDERVAWPDAPPCSASCQARAGTCSAQPLAGLRPARFQQSANGVNSQDLGSGHAGAAAGQHAARCELVGAHAPTVLDPLPRLDLLHRPRQRWPRDRHQPSCVPASAVRRPVCKLARRFRSRRASRQYLGRCPDLVQVSPGDHR